MTLWVDGLISVALMKLSSPVALYSYFVAVICLLAELD